mmetsp:Transcript_26239/g.66876  ORF Transcript_26239/g.66876 Transcript_26239/m.66876 type:complete len:216 (+) Transcript_26239:46-693(+)
MVDERELRGAPSLLTMVHGRAATVRSPQGRVAPSLLRLPSYHVIVRKTFVHVDDAQCGPPCRLRSSASDPQLSRESHRQPSVQGASASTMAERGRPDCSASTATRSSSQSRGDPHGDGRRGASEDDEAPPDEAKAPPSLGSVNHASGTCRPCSYFGRSKCAMGATCNFCHYGHAKERRPGKKSREARKRYDASHAKHDGDSDEGSCRAGKTSSSP